MSLALNAMHKRLKRARIIAGFHTAKDAIERFGWSGSTYRAHENGQNQFNAAWARTYADAYGVSAGWLLTGEGQAPRAAAKSAIGIHTHDTNSTSSIFIRSGSVAVGVWREVAMEEYSQLTKAKSQFSPDPRFPIAAQFDVVVADLSFSKHALIGDYLRCVDIELAGIEIQDEDFVLIECVYDSPSGQLKETTAKRVRRNGYRYEFWPDVEDTHWETPILIKDEANGDGADITIKAKIIFAFRPLK